MYKASNTLFRTGGGVIMLRNYNFQLILLSKTKQKRIPNQNQNKLI